MKRAFTNHHRIIWSLFLGLLLSQSLSGQQQVKVPANLVRDTIITTRGLVYYGRITHHKSGVNTRMIEPRGWSRVVEAADIREIGWSERSRYRFAEELVSLDSVRTIDIVYLTDGSVLRGRILSYQPGEKLKFQLNSGGEVELADSGIEKIVQEPEDPLVATLLRRQKAEKVYAFRETGFYCATVFALLPGGGEYRSEMGLSLQASFGYQLNRHLGLGIGASIDGYANQASGDTFLPLFAEARGYLLKKKRTPYWVVAAGYGFPLQTNMENQEIRRFEGGYMIHPAVGYRLGADKHLNMTLDLGYKFQKALTEREFLFSGDILTRDVVYRRLCLRMSVIF